MEITLNHTIVPAQNNVVSAQFYARIFGFHFVKEWGHFAVVQVNSTLTLDFITQTSVIPSLHYAFKVSEQQFDEIFTRIKQEGIHFGSGPSVRNNSINTNDGGRGCYFEDPSGHVLEILTKDYVLD